MIRVITDMKKLKDEYFDFLIGSKIISVDYVGEFELLETLQITTNKGIIQLTLNSNDGEMENWNEIHLTSFDRNLK